MFSSISLMLFFSTRESSILHGILDCFTAKDLLRKYKEEYLIEEIRYFIPNFEIEQLK